MQAFKTLVSKTVALRGVNIDTDQIIPARFLKVTDKVGMGDHAFADWRYHADGSLNAAFPLNWDEARDARILVAGHNFGCGSSREHAPWALLGLGLAVVISTEIADIFRNNSLKNGLLPIVVDAAFHQHLLDTEGQTVEVDLERNTITAGERSYVFNIEPFARYCLLQGMDQLDYLLSLDREIQQYEEKSA